MPRHLDLVALGLVFAALGAGLARVPGWVGFASDPCLQGAGACALVVVVLVVLRALGERAERLERAVCAVFLAAMPVPYVWSCALAAGGGEAPLALELVALPLYGGLGWLGWRRGAPWLVLGTAAHGILWDSWHLHGTSFLPSWYARACLLIDLPLALYIAARCPRWRARRAAQAAAIERA